MGDLLKLIDEMDPEEAAAEIAAAINKLFPLLSEQARLQFAAGLAGDSGGDKLTSMVHF